MGGRHSDIGAGGLEEGGLEHLEDIALRPVAEDGGELVDEPHVIVGQSGGEVGKGAEVGVFASVPGVEEQLAEVGGFVAFELGLGFSAAQLGHQLGGNANFFRRNIRFLFSHLSVNRGTQVP